MSDRTESHPVNVADSLSDRVAESLSDRDAGGLLLAFLVTVIVVLAAGTGHF